MLIVKSMRRNSFQVAMVGKTLQPHGIPLRKLLPLQALFLILFSEGQKLAPLSGRSQAAIAKLEKRLSARSPRKTSYPLPQSRI
jgi:hypothetical protein